MFALSRKEMVKVHSYDKVAVFTAMKFSRRGDLNTWKQVRLLENVGYLDEELLIGWTFHCWKI